MTGTSNIREGMQVYGAGDQLLGTIERLQGDGFDVAGYHYTREMVARVAQNRVYVRGTGTVEDRDEREIRVPVAEERLSVGTHEVELGEIEIRKTVTEEQRTIPVTLTHEEVHVEEHTVAERPATGERLFQEETIRVALRGEEAVVGKEAFVTGEVVIDKNEIVEERQITDTVRSQHVEVEQNEVTTRRQQVEVERNEATTRVRDTKSPKRD